MPTTLNDLQADWQQHYRTYTEAYQSGQASFIPNLLPQTAVGFSVYQTLEILHRRLGNETLRRALDPAETLKSPAAGRPDGSWLKRSNMVGINVRTLGSFWQVINYVLTLPASHDSIHLLPIWEPGVVGSLYGMVSWQINPEFFDVDLARYVPALGSVEKQLKVLTNLLHALGRTVGMDVIPHTDRFSEMVLACPALFEWVQREVRSAKPDENTNLVQPASSVSTGSGRSVLLNHSSLVYRYVEEAIWQFLKVRGTADGSPLTVAKDVFFSMDTAILIDDQRVRILFGYPHDYGGRLNRRLALIRHLTDQGFETLPMTMAPPYRGLHINPADYVRDDFDQIWYQYAFDQPQPMSRVFGPLARYRFYESKNDNQDWALDFDRPNQPAWNYVCQKFGDCQRAYNFDFMRGDMAHVQMRPGGVPAQAATNPDYDPLRAIKRYVQGNGTPHYAFFAETFLAPPNTMSYGDEPDHLEAIDADSTLGDLQSLVVGSEAFKQKFGEYYQYLKTRRFAPNFTVMTADKDDPRFDEFYRTGNLFRYFTALFLTDMPSYVGLGFELRNRHETRGLNEEYSKLYVFHIEDDRQPDKVTHGPYVWGQNADQFAAITRIRLFAEGIWPEIVQKETRWLVAPDEADYIIWTHVEPTGESTPGQSRPGESTLGYVFVASMTGELPETVPGASTGELVFEEDKCQVWRIPKA